MLNEYSKMKKMILVFALTMNQIASAQAETSMPLDSTMPDEVTQEQMLDTQTYVRCWYRSDISNDSVATDWKWARDKGDNYYTIEGYWWSPSSYKNMFFSETPQSEIKQRCDETLDLQHDAADITYFAADSRFSYNHSIWTNDEERQENQINRIITFGDSLSDTGNLFNGSQWVFPNANSWFLGHFSNGLVWTEYLAKEKKIPLYNWAVGGAAGTNQYGVLKGIYDQVTSYLRYMEAAKNYKPENSLFTLEFGLNDFMNYDRSVVDVKADFSSALIRLTGSGAQNILLFTLPDATKAPQFKYTSDAETELVRRKIIEFNLFIEEQVSYYKQRGLNIVLFDAYTLFNSITENPQQHGFQNATEPCLDIQRHSAADYLYQHNLTNECAAYGSDHYVFWGVTHPTTAVHKYLAEHILMTHLSTFNFD